MWRTSLGAEYPAGMCSAWAKALGCWIASPTPLTQDESPCDHGHIGAADSSGQAGVSTKEAREKENARALLEKQELEKAAVRAEEQAAACCFL